MFSQKSIKTEFILQLVVASTTLIVIFSIVLYNYIKISIYEDLRQELIGQTTIILNSDTYDITRFDLSLSDKNLLKNNINIEMVTRVSNKPGFSFEQFELNNRHYLALSFPYDKAFSGYLKLTQDITNTDNLLKNILFNILTINLSAIVLILFYALFLSRMLLLPIKILNYKLSQINENFLNQIDLSVLPLEFLLLGKSVNGLIDRIQTFIKYQKELFIGIAHELKTPLAVMKTKNEVTLIKKRDEEKYIEALKSNNVSIDEMNTMISSILEIGRQEGAQFEEPVEIDLIFFLKERVNNFKILARQENKHLTHDLSPQKYKVKIQPTLLVHILQNFIQNAIKFTNEEGTILVKSMSDKRGFTIEVIDEGDGAEDNSKDYFAPFKKFGDKSGAGLGLFIAKGAADAIGATISLKNRTDNKCGAVASIFIPNYKKIDID